jgi:hypothetical protein
MMQFQAEKNESKSHETHIKIHTLIASTTLNNMNGTRYKNCFVDRDWINFYIKVIVDVAKNIVVTIN